MHDSRFPNILRNVLLPLFTGIVLLTAIPFLFKRPVTTLRGPLDMAVHGYQLSDFGKVWDGKPSLPPIVQLPPSSRMAFGTHDLYPLRFHTARDTVSGEALVRIVSPVDMEEFPEDTTWNGHRVRFARNGGALYALFSDNGTVSWPGELFSIISNR